MPHDAMDAHATLGLAEDASPDEIKRAYRRLAMRWHPDRNPDPAAVERFKEIRAAYDLLTSVEEESETVDVAPDVPAGDASGGRPPQAADIRLNLHLDLEFAARGGATSVRYSRGLACATCAGSGESGMARTRFCGACHGSGRIRDAARSLIACPDCGGRGFFKERICPDCQGSGRELGEVLLDVQVPPGMLTGDELRLAGQGEPGDDQRRPGDLYLTVVLADHPRFALHGRDLHVRCPVSALTMLAGGEIRLPGLGGEFSWTLDAAEPRPADLRLPGYGYPGRGRHPAGDLVVRLQPQFPRQLTPRQRQTLLTLDAALLAARASHFPDWPEDIGA